MSYGIFVVFVLVLFVCICVVSVSVHAVLLYRHWGFVHVGIYVCVFMLSLYPEKHSDLAVILSFAAES